MVAINTPQRSTSLLRHRSWTHFTLRPISQMPSTAPHPVYTIDELLLWVSQLASAVAPTTPAGTF
jgi:hypothetical protein